jgi:holo-[acyl-carrier protein] synthase
VGWREIEVVTAASGRPDLMLYGSAAELAAELGLCEWAVSLSHTAEQAVAFVVATH